MQVIARAQHNSARERPDRARHNHQLYAASNIGRRPVKMSEIWIINFSAGRLLSVRTANNEIDAR
jgi:hypothetical protein